MKKSMLNSVQQILATLFLSLWSMAAVAQDSTATKTTTSSSTTSSSFEVQPWMWIAGGIIVLIIIIAMLSGRKTDTTVTKTTIYKDRA